MKKGLFVVAAAALFACGAAWAQPRIVSLGDNAVGVAAANGGSVVVGSAGGVAARWTISGAGATLQLLPGSNSATGITPDGQYIVGPMANATGLGGYPTDSTIAGRWSQATGWSPLPLVTANPALGVSGPGIGGGEIASPRGMSATGEFVVGQSYIAPDETYRFRGWYWDSSTDVSQVLPTTLNPQNGRYRDSRALAVSSDGAVIVGGEDPHSSNGRLVVWRWNSTSSSYEMSYLPDGTDDRGNPFTRSVDQFYINAAGTMIVGTSYEFDKDLGYGVGPYLARWTWNAGAGEWERELLGHQLTVLPTWWEQPGWCDIPHQLIPTGMSDDGNTIVGIVMYSLCGSFQRGGFIWTAEDGQILDLYDSLVDAGTPGIEAYGAEQFGLPPKLGWANGISPDGRTVTGYGGPFSGFGPGWVVSLDGGKCIPPFITGSPEDVLLSRCSTFIMNAGAGGSGELTYQWMKDGQPLNNGTTPGGSEVTGATTSQLRITQISAENVGNYSCVITGDCGSPVSTAVATAALDPNVTPATNDTCDTATAVGEGSFDFNPCGAFVNDGVIATCVPLMSTEDLWYVYTPTFTGEVRIDTCAANYDTVLSVYDGCLGSEIACNDDRDTGPLGTCSWTASRISGLPVTQGVPVYIRVSNIGYLFEFSAGQLTIQPNPAPAANDMCDNATPAVLGDNAFSTDEATVDGAAGCSFAVDSRDVWFTYTSPSDTQITLTTCGGADWSTVISVYDQCFGNELACNQSAGGPECWSQSTIADFPVTAGVTYVIRVGTAFNGDGGGPGVLNISAAGGCTADFNADGVVNSQDFFDFLNTFFANSPKADFNNDDVVNSQDFFDFLNVFFVPC